MQKITVITCFSYIGNRKYVFNPQYLRSDLRRIITFAHNRMGCPLENIYVITDLYPLKQTRDEILQDLRDEILEYFADLGYSETISKISGSTTHWIRQLCNRAASKLNANPEVLYNNVGKNILPIIRNSSVVEFASLFTNFININSKADYDNILEDIFNLPNITNLFFYYTGHGVRLWNSSGKYEICLVIPGKNASAEFYHRRDLQKRFNPILKAEQKMSSFVVFDCCHAETLLELPIKLTFNSVGQIKSHCDNQENYKSEIVYLSSTRNDQTCGFYVSSDGSGSLFTYFLIKFLENLSHHRSRHLSQLYTGVEEKVQHYRSISEKPPQNMLIKLNQHISSPSIPAWLFEGRDNSFRLVERND